jgi:hypothetical protein
LTLPLYWEGKGVLEEEATFSGELLSLGSDRTVVTLDPSCAGVAGSGLCVVKSNKSGVFLLSDLPAATVPMSVGVRGEAIAFATSNRSAFEGFTIFVRSSAGVQMKSRTRARAERSGSWC